MPRSPLGLPVLHLIHYVCMPSPLPRQVRWNRFAHYCSISFVLPHITVGSAPALHFSRPAQRSLALQPADSPSRLMRPSTSEAPTALLSPPPLRLLPGGAIQFPGGSSSRCGPVPFHGALQWGCYANYTAHCSWQAAIPPDDYGPEGPGSFRWIGELRTSDSWVFIRIAVLRCSNCEVVPSG